MFNLVLCDETNGFLKEIRKDLKSKGYDKTISRCNRHIGNIHFNYIYEYYTKAYSNVMFEIEKDLANNSVSAKLHYIDNNGNKRFKNIMLSDIKDLA